MNDGFRSVRLVQNDVVIGCGYPVRPTSSVVDFEMDRVLLMNKYVDSFRSSPFSIVASLSDERPDEVLHARCRVQAIGTTARSGETLLLEHVIFSAFPIENRT